MIFFLPFLVKVLRLIFKEIYFFYPGRKCKIEKRKHCHHAQRKPVPQYFSVKMSAIVGKILPTEPFHQRCLCGSFSLCCFAFFVVLCLHFVFRCLVDHSWFSVIKQQPVDFFLPLCIVYTCLSGSQIHERTISWRFLSIILRGFCIQSLHYKPVSNHFCSNLLVELTVNSKEENSLRRLSQLRPRIGLGKETRNKQFLALSFAKFLYCR